MRFDYCVMSDIGAVRSTNQDSSFAGIIGTRLGKAFFGIVCDGMGGLSDGGFASNTVVRIFSDWFYNEIKHISENDVIGEIICSQWHMLMDKSREIFIEHVGNSDRTMGTTLSALLIVNGKYYAAQVGDSRIYLFRNGLATQITTDHSYVAELAEKGLMTFDEANVAENKNILTRCIGNMCKFSPDFYFGDVCHGDCFSISSDGFHGGMIASEMNGVLTEIFSVNGRKMRKALEQSIVLKMEKGEKDNITAICLKTL